MKLFELVHSAARGIADCDHFGGQLDAWDIDHTLLAFFKMLKVWFRLLITQPMIGGSKSIIICHDMVMILVDG